MTLYNSSGAFIATVDAYGTGSDENLYYCCSSTDYYYVQIDGYGNTYGSYNFGYRISSLSAPTPVSAYQSGNSISVSWGTVSGATSYKIYKSSSSSGTYSQIGTALGTSYTDNSPLCGYNYYKVVTVISSCESSQSSYASANYTVPAPTGLSASQSGTTVNVSWSSVSNATSYIVYRSSSASDTYSQIGTISNTSYTDYSPLPGSNYYRVKAINSLCESSFSDYVLVNYIVTVVPTITTTSLPNGIIGTSYSQTLSVTGTTPITWSLISGSLPNGLTLLSSTGVISGTPTTAGTFNFTVQATNSAGNNTKTLSITVNPNFIPVTNITGVPTTATAGTPLILTGTVVPSNATNTTISWSVVNAGTTGATISGNTLNTSAAGTVTVRATIPNGTAQGTDYIQNFTITVTAPTAAPIITTTSLPNVEIGMPYYQTLSATGTTPITWSLIGGSLPNGLTLLSSAGVISGTPTTVGTFNFTVQATNTAGNNTKALSITVNRATLTGTVVITGSAIFSETLTANTTNLSSTPLVSLGTLTYQWKRGATNIGTNSPNYTLVQADIGNTITVTVTAANCDGSRTSDPTATVTKATQTPPSAPTLASKTEISITLNAIPGCEYNRDGGSWQTFTTFSGLTPNTSYSFRARKAETATHLASPQSAAATFNTGNVGIVETQCIASLQIYPNPTTGELTITNYELEITGIEILDMAGRKVSSHHLIASSSNHLINISHLSAGIYFVKIFTEAGEVVRKVVKE